MSQSYSSDNVYLDGGTLLGGSGTHVVGACLYTDASSNRYIYIANDDDGLSGYAFSDHTLYGVLACPVNRGHA